MKKSLLILITSFIGTLSFAQNQVPNSGFEDWSFLSDNSTLYPTNWSETGVCIKNSPVDICASNVRQTSTAVSGNYAVEVFTNVVEGNVNYESFSNVNAESNGVAFTGRPTSLTFMVKFHTTADNKLNVRNMIYTTTNNLLDGSTIIATIDKVVSTTELSETEFVKVTIPITYMSDAIPTHNFIRFSFENRPTVGGEYFILDDIKYEYDFTTSTTDSKNSQLTKLLTVNQSELKLTTECESIAVYTLQGNKVAEVEYSDKLNISHLPASVYLLKAANENGVYTTKFVK